MHFYNWKARNSQMYGTDYKPLRTPSRLTALDDWHLLKIRTGILNVLGYLNRLGQTDKCIELEWYFWNDLDQPLMSTSDSVVNLPDTHLIFAGMILRLLPFPVVPLPVYLDHLFSFCRLILKKNVSSCAFSILQNVV
jgi:hypothetical protein